MTHNEHTKGSLTNAMRFCLDLLRFAAPVIGAFVLGALVLLLLGKDPLAYYSYIVQRALGTSIGLEAVCIRMAPLMLISAGLIVAFKAGIWNLGTDGQFLLAAVITAAVAPTLAMSLPVWGLVLACMLIAFITGALWGMLPAFLKVRYGLNEVITTLMTSFIGISLANLLIKFPFRDTAIPHPQTFTLPLQYRLPRLFESSVHGGVLVALGVVLFVHWLMQYTSLGVRIRILGMHPKAAYHAGYPVGTLSFLAFITSAGLIGVAGCLEVLGVYGTVQAGWNPGYGMLAIPLVFLARCNGIGVIFFAVLFSVLLVGGESASRVLDVPSYYIMVLLAICMMLSASMEVIYARKS